MTEELDAGPIVVQKRCSVEPNDTPETLKEKVQVLEGDAFIESIKKFQEGKMADFSIQRRYTGVS